MPEPVSGAGQELDGVRLTWEAEECAQASSWAPVTTSGLQEEGELSPGASHNGKEYQQKEFQW